VAAIHVKMVLCRPIAKYKVPDNVEKYTMVNGRRSLLNRVITWFQGPYRNEKLVMVKRLPREKRRENFLALMTMKGMYILASPKHIKPRIMLVMKPNILCFLFRAGIQLGAGAGLDPNQLELLASPFSESIKGCWSSDILPESPNGDFKLGSLSLPARFVSELEDEEDVFFK